MSSFVIGRPDGSDYSPAFAEYVSRVPESEILPALAEQIAIVETAFASVAPSAERFRYTEGKWSVRQLAGHIADCERIMGYRALSIARGETQDLPGFEEDDYVRNAPFEDVPLADLVREWRLLRESHVLLLKHFAADAWLRKGSANHKQATPRGMAYVLVGHVRHHLAVFEERYRPGIER